jgi:hypothetical protein
MASAIRILARAGSTETTSRSCPPSVRSLPRPSRTGAGVEGRDATVRVVALTEASGWSERFEDHYGGGPEKSVRNGIGM